MDSQNFWKRFSFEYRYHAGQLQKSLIAIEAHRQSARHLILAPEWVEQLDRLNRVRAVHGTTAIEGNPLSEAEVASQMELIEQELEGSNKDESKGLLKEQRQIQNAARAQEWVKRRFTPGSAPLRMDDILKMHLMLTKGSDEVNNVPGHLRRVSVEVGTLDLGGVHKGAPYERLASLMEEFIGFLHSKRLEAEHPVIQALLAHFFLVTIHPFGDGNGRVSRLVEASTLFRQDYNVHGFYGLSNFFYKNADRYKILLQRCRRAVSPFDVSEFINFGVEGFAQELRGINNFVKAKLNRVMYRQMLAASHNRQVSPRRRLLSNREVQLLQFLLDETEPEDPFSESPSRRVSFDEALGSAFMTAAYREVTDRTVIREFLRLDDLGFIKLDVQKRGEYWVEIDFDAIGKYSIS